MITFVSKFLSILVHVFAFLGVKVEVPFVKETISIGGNSVVNVAPTTEVTFGRPECANCTQFIKNYNNALKVAIRNFDFSQFTYQQVPFCHKCYASGLENVSLYGDACVNPVANSPNVTTTKSNYQWDNMVMSCDCELATNPIALIEQLQSVVTTCPDGTTEIIPPNMSSVQKASSAIANSKACAPPTGTLIPHTQTVTISMSRKNTKGSITVRKDKNIKGLGSVTLLEGGVIERNMTDIDETCHSNATLFDICQCLIGNNIVISIWEQLVELITQCVLKSRNNLLLSALDSYAVCEA